MSFQRPQDAGFFVGYFKKVPPAIKRFVLVVGAVSLAGFSVLAGVLSFATDDPGDGGYAFGDNDLALEGVMEIRPYPVLHIPASARRPAHAIMLAGESKEGIQLAAMPFDGQPVATRGVLLKRGDLEMALLTAPLQKPAAPPVTAAQTPIPHIEGGRWRIAGEICDGKCYAGAMKPGNGLAHKACANLCLTGGVPPVFVTRTPVNESTFFLMADASGGPLSPSILQSTAVPVSLEGTVQMRDDMPVFLVDPASLKRLP